MNGALRLGRLALVLTLLCLPTGAAADALWDSQPYQVVIRLDADESGLTGPQQERLQRDLGERLTDRLGRFWRVRFDSDGDTDAADSMGEDQTALDKRITLFVRSDAGGYVVEAVEHDLTINHTGAPTKTRTPGAADLPERVYRAALAAFRPVASFQRDPEAPDRVTLAYRAADLAPRPEVGRASPGELLLPFRRRVDRDGRALAAKQTPWTYLMATADEDGTSAGADVVSHARRPFGTRPSGRVEQLAIATPVDESRRTVLRLHALDHPETPLPGYEVSLGKPGDVESLQPLGFTDEDGAIKLPAETGVWMAHVKCGSLVVASLPVSPGVAEEIAIPLIDERSRLRAELEVTSLREQLIDTVARRKILAERIRRLANDEQIDAAKRLLSELEDLPGRTQFTQRLEAARRAARADHPIAKARLDRLFNKTVNVLNKALDPRETRDLSIEISRAEQDAAIRGSSG